MEGIGETGLERRKREKEPGRGKGRGERREKKEEERENERDVGGSLFRHLPDDRGWHPVSAGNFSFSLLDVRDLMRELSFFI